MSKKLQKPKHIIIERKRVPAFLSRKYMQDCEASLADFPDDKKVEFLEHLLDCFDIIEKYFANPTPENYKIYANKENAFLKKHGTRLKMYRQTRMYLYYGDSTLLVDKDIYTADEWNALGKEQRLSANEYAEFIDLCRSRLYLERDFFMLRQNPEDEKGAEEKNKSKGTSETLDGLNNFPSFKRFKGGRKQHDNLTCLNQEQTALVMYYLQHENVFLKSHYLDDTTMGIAFEILTGYSFNTLRQTVGKFGKSKTPENVKEISKLLARLKTALDEA